jgi:HK97 family phage major capsid protein
MKPTYAEAVALHSELTGIIAKAAAESRELTDNEKTRVVEIQTKSAEFQAAAVDDSEGRRAFLSNVEKSNRKTGLVLKASDSFADHFKTGDEPELSLAKSLRGYLTGEWDGAELERKAMASSALGAILPTPISNQIIDLARNQSTVIRAGAVTVPMTTATLKLARMTGDVTAAWYAEAGEISESDATLDSVTLTARKMACMVRINREILEDSDPGVDGIIRNSVAQAMALELDRVALVGTGTAPQPRGLQNVVGINTVTSVGTPADYGKFLDAIFECRLDNFEPNAVINSVRTAKTLAKLFTGISSDKTPLMMPSDYSALTRFASNQIPVNLGAGTNESLAFVGKFDELMIGLRQNIIIEVSNSAADVFEKDQVMLRATWRGDVQVTRATAFCLMSGITA